MHQQTIIHAPIVRARLAIVGAIAAAAAFALLSGPAFAQDDSAWQALEAQQQGQTGFQHASGNGIVILIDRPGTTAQPLAQQVRSVAGPMIAPNVCPRMGTIPFTAGPTTGAIQLVVQAPDNGFTCSAIAIQTGGRTIIALSMEGTTDGVDGRGFARRQFDSALARARADAPAIARPANPAPSATPAARTVPAGGAATTAPRGLVGMWRADWVENSYVYPTGLTLQHFSRTLIFTAGGLFMNGVEAGYALNDEGARARAASDPDKAGRYSVSGSVITLTYASGRQERVTQARGGGGPMLRYDGREMAPKLTFPDGYRLSGTYSNQRITYVAGGNFVVGDSDLSFAADGRFARGGQVSVTTQVRSAIGRRQGRTGRYEVRGSALYLSYDDGETEILPMFQENRGREIWFNDQMYQPAR